MDPIEQLEVYLRFTVTPIAVGQLIYNKYYQKSPYDFCKTHWCKSSDKSGLLQASF